MDTQEYWKKQHKKYVTFDWIDKPTIFAQEALNYFPVNGKILELGCGQGQDSRFFANNGYSVIATDFSDEALKLAQQKTDKSLKVHYKNLNLTQNFPFEDQSFDIVYSHLALHYFDKKTTQGLFKEIVRVLKKGGILAVLVNTTDDSETKEGHKKLEEDLYEVNEIIKRYFSTTSLKEYIEDDFISIVIDNKGKTYKDKISSLIRFIGKKK